MKTKISGVVLAVLLLGGCAQTGPNETTGMILGGATGAVVGSMFGGGTGTLVGTAIGTAIGSSIGANVGRQLDVAAKQQHEYAVARSLSSGNTITWNTVQHPSERKSSGRVEVLRSTRDGYNRLCREFQQTITIGGKTTTGYGTACQDRAGNWVIHTFS